MELEKLDPDQAFWDYAAVRDDVPAELKLLVDRDRVPVDPSRVMSVFAYLRVYLGMTDEDEPTVRTPVRLIVAGQPHEPTRGRSVESILRDLPTGLLKGR